MNKKRLYYILQTGGWLVYVLIAGVLDVLSGHNLKASTVIQLTAAFIIGWGCSHFYRILIIRLGWTKLKIKPLIPRVLFSSILFALIFQILYAGATMTALQDVGFSLVESLSRILNWSLLFVLWSVIYFAYHFFEQYRSEEIKNLKWQASKNEIELNKLKSQLNPHFIFNSLNTIRALIDENPKVAKSSVTDLSVLLRKTLLMGREKTVTLKEELEVVESYLALESARYEERLQTEIDIQKECYAYRLPGLILQTLVENAIKHGIAKLPQGGTLSITGKTTAEGLSVEIRNPGRVSGSDRKEKETGFGIKNSKERLRLLYGREDLLIIENEKQNLVRTRILIPEKIPA